MIDDTALDFIVLSVCLSNMFRMDSTGSHFPSALSGPAGASPHQWRLHTVSAGYLGKKASAMWVLLLASLQFLLSHLACFACFDETL